MSRPSIVITDDGIRLHIKWFCEDSGTWHDILEDFKRTFWRHGDKTFSGITKTWSVPGWHKGRLHEWCDSWFDDDCQRWACTDPYGSRSYGGRARGDGSYSYGRQGGSGSSTRSDGVAAAYKVLHLLPSAPLWAAEAVYRAAVKVYHPDAGGSHEAAVAVNVAMELIRDTQPKEKRC